MVRDDAGDPVQRSSKFTNPAVMQTECNEARIYFKSSFRLAMACSVIHDDLTIPHFDTWHMYLPQGLKKLMNI